MTGGPRPAIQSRASFPGARGPREARTERSRRPRVVGPCAGDPHRALEFPGGRRALAALREQQPEGEMPVGGARVARQALPVVLEGRLAIARLHPEIRAEEPEHRSLRVRTESLVAGGNRLRLAL